eukprot:scaffold3418_cov124-Isochrysis_galbana.AAC.41
MARARVGTIRPASTTGLSPAYARSSGRGSRCLQALGRGSLATASAKWKDGRALTFPFALFLGEP